MAIKRYESTSEIVGQFLPKVYTRRITLESIGNDPKEGKTAVTVDYQIKDVLDQNGLGIITQTRKDVVEGGRMAEEDMQDDVLKALKVIVVAVDGAETGNTLSNQIYNLSNFPNARGRNFEQALEILTRGYRGLRIPIEKSVNLARPAALGFEFRNTIYQEYDINNNVVNIIPGEQTFILENKEWDNLNNLSIICFSYFDFESLGLTTDNFSEEDARKLSYTVGDLTLDAVTRGGRIVSTASIYKLADNGQPYYGPVHYHGSGNPGPGGYTGYMAGYAGADMGPKLNKEQVPITKIQDFRVMQRTKLVNYQPDQLEYFNNRKPDLSFLDRGDKNYFGLDRVIVNYDKEEQETNIEFTANMFDIYKRNSRYYPLLKSAPILSWAAPTVLMSILEMKIVRRRMTTGLPGTDRLGSKKRIAFMPESEAEHIVIASSDGGPGSLNPSSDDYYGAVEQTGRGFSTRSFKASDFQIGDYHGTNGIYQYGVELRVVDNTKPFMLTKLERARRAIKNLKIYSQESKIPVFDTYNVKKPEENLPIGLSEDPIYTESVSTIGNYDSRTRTFTSKFIADSRRKYDFREYVDSFRDLLFFSFGRSEVQRTRRATENVQLENQLQTPLSALESLQNDGFLPDPESISRTELYNMINPSNTNPETIDSFITSFEDLVLEMEEYFGAKHNLYISSEGSGYSAKSGYTFTVKRWLNSTNFDIDIDTFVHLEPFRDEVSFDYDIARPTYTGPRTATFPIFLRRLEEEAVRYDIPPGNPVALSPRFLNLGNWVMCFDREMIKMKRDQFELEKKEASKMQLRASRRRRNRGRRQRGMSKWQRKLKRLSKKKFIFLDPASSVDSNAVSNYITGLRKLVRVRGPAAPTNFLRSIDNLDTSNFFEGLRAINDQLSNNITNYGSLTNATTLVDITRELPFPENPNECGLIDNTPKDFRLPLITDFLDREDFFFGFGFAQEEVIPEVLPLDLPTVEPPTQTVPPITTVEVPTGPTIPGPVLPAIPTMPTLDIGTTIEDLIPQVRSTSFPTGGVFEEAMVFATDSNSGGVLTYGGVNSGATGTGKIQLVSADIATGNGVGKPMGSQTRSSNPKPMPTHRESGASPTPTYSVLEVGLGTTVATSGATSTSQSPTSPGLTAGAAMNVGTSAVGPVASADFTASPAMQSAGGMGNFGGGTGAFAGAFGGFGGY